jgi:hypothetical protein
MTDPLTTFDKLAGAARMEEIPSIDVSGRVMVAIRRQESAHGYAPLQWIAAGSIVAATAMSLSMVSLYQTWSDPLNTLFLDVFGGLL